MKIHIYLIHLFLNVTHSNALIVSPQLEGARCYQKCNFTGTWEQTQLGRETVTAAAAKNHHE